VSCALPPDSFYGFLFGRVRRLSLPRLPGQLPGAQLPHAAIDPQPASIFLQLIERLARRHSFRPPEDEHFPRGSTHFRLEAETKG
jgi:hypothetical protein